MANRESKRRSRLASIRKSIAIIVKDRSTNYLIVAFVLMAAIFQVAGDATSGWMVLDAKASNPLYDSYIDVELGLIYVKYCTPSRCETLLVDSFNHEKFMLSEEELLEYRIEVGIGLLMALVSIVLCCRLTCCNGGLNSKRGCLICIFMTSLLSGAATLTAVGRFGVTILDDHRAKGDNSAYKTPYSLLLALIGGIFAAMTAVTSLVDIFRTSCCDREQGNAA